MEPLQFPKPQLRVRPVKLHRAVEELEVRRGGQQPPASRMAAFRAMVREQSPREVAFAMTARMHRWMVQLAAEGDPVLGGRIAALAMELVHQGRTDHLLELAPWLGHEQPLMASLADVAQREWGTPSIPPWLDPLKAGPEALRNGGLPESLAAHAQSRSLAWPEVVARLELPPPSPLAAHVLQRSVSDATATWTSAQDDGLVARWAGDNALPREIATTALIKLLSVRARTLAGSDRVGALMSGPVSDLLDSLERRLGGPLWQKPRLWSHVPEEVLALARLRHSIQIVLRNFEPRRRQFWLGWLSEADDVRPIRTGIPFGQPLGPGGADAVLIKLRGRCFLEFSSTGHACYAYSHEDWDQLVRTVRRPTAAALRIKKYTHTINWLSHQGDWEYKFRRYIERLPRG